MTMRKWEEGGGLEGWTKGWKRCARMGFGCEERRKRSIRGRRKRRKENPGLEYSYRN